MEFSNQGVDAKEFPQLAELDFTSLSPRYRPSHMLTTAAVFTVILLVLTIVRFQPFVSLPEELNNLYVYAVLAVTFVATLTLGYQFFADPKKRYALREQDIHYTHGLIFSRLVTQPILRIQHVEIKRGPVERFFGLASLQVFSAGGALHTFEIPGLEEATAQKIRGFILSHGDINTHG